MLDSALAPAAYAAHRDVLPLLTFVILTLGGIGLAGYVLRLDFLYGWFNYTRMAVHTVIEEIRRTFQGVMHASSFGDFRVTLSCGVATFASGQDAETLLDLADRAFYRAKQLGRNRVEVPPSAARTSEPAPDKRREGLPFRRPSSTRMRRVRGPG